MRALLVIGAFAFAGCASAPQPTASSGKSVRSDRLDNPYWKKHLSEARRLTV